MSADERYWYYCSNCNRNVRWKRTIDGAYRCTICSQLATPYSYKCSTKDCTEYITVTDYTVKMLGTQMDACDTCSWRFCEEGLCIALSTTSPTSVTTDAPECDIEM